MARPRSDGKREMILDAAVGVIAAEGVHGTTTRKIAAAAGINLGTLHYHFRSKEEVLMCVSEHLVARYRADLARAFPEPEGLRVRIGRLMRFIWGEVQKSPDEQLVLLDMLLFTMTGEWRKRFEPLPQSPYQMLYRTMLEQTSEVRSGSSVVDVEQLANFLFDGFTGLLLHWLATADKKRADDQLELLIRGAEQLFL